MYTMQSYANSIYVHIVHALFKTYLFDWLRGLTANAEHENAGHENTVNEIARHDKYRMKIDCITVQCVFLLNF